MRHARIVYGFAHGVFALRIEQREAHAAQRLQDLCVHGDRVKTRIRNAADGGDVRADLHAAAGKQLACDTAGKDQRRSEPGGKVAAAARVVVSAVLDKAGVVRVARAHAGAQLHVVAGTGVGIFDHAADRRAGSAPLKHAGEDVDLIRFFARGGGGIVAGGAARHVRCDGRLVNHRAGGYAVDDHADAVSVALTENAQLKMLAECTSHRAMPPSDANSSQNAGADLATDSLSVMVMSPSAMVEATAMAMTMR